MIATVITISLSQLSTGSGANGVAQAGRAPASPEVGGSNPFRLVAPEKCSAHRALAFYVRRANDWRKKMGAAAERSSVPRTGCPRYLARVYKAKARNARKAYERWHHYHYAWRTWLPSKHQRVAACETGHQGGTGPGGSRWDWDSGTYVSAFGIYRAGYDDDAHRVGNFGWDETIRELGRYPTPREQMQAADSHRAAHGGWSGWGCRGA